MPPITKIYLDCKKICKNSAQYCIIMKEFSVCVFLQVFYLYVNPALGCILVVMKMSN